VIPDVRTPHGGKRPLLLQLVFLCDRIGETLPLDYLNVTHHALKYAAGKPAALTGGSE